VRVKLHFQEYWKLDFSLVFCARYNPNGEALVLCTLFEKASLPELLETGL